MRNRLHSSKPSLIWQRAQLALALLTLLVASIGGIAQQAQQQYRSAEAEVQSGALSRSDRLEIFEEVWEDINEYYYDPNFNGVDWRAVRARYRPLVDAASSDEEFYTLMKRMVGELRDAHTRFHTPREREERKQHKSTSAGFSVYEIEGQTVIVSVDPASEAARAGVNEGMIVRAIDGKPVAEKLAEAQAAIGGSSTDRAVQLRLYRKILEGVPDTPLALALARPDGSEFEVTVTRREVSDRAQVKWYRLASGYGYIRLNVWREPAHKEFKNALERLKHVPGLIVDLRGNPGGEVNEVLRIAGYFLPDKKSFGSFIKRSGEAIQLFAGRRGEQVYAGPLVILVNEGSGSGSEMFAGGLQDLGRASVIGRQSCGCLLGISKFREVEGGGEVAISELGYLSPKKKKFEGAGVTPDQKVALTLADLRRRRDSTIETAETVLRAALRNVTTQN
ncbi:MAG TPA: S41 family peptidase [Blastocatellia bacterium]|nr:S41 family peptidase [Blastocatellia bacterium]